MHVYFARGGGGHASSSHASSARSSSSSSRSSSSSSSSSKSSSSSSKPSSSSSKSTTSAKTKVTDQKTSTKPGTAIKTADGKTVKSSTKTPTNTKYKNEQGIIGANGYTPRFNNYSAPAGSTVYYPQHSALDYLPWIYLFSASSPSRDQAVIVQPDNKQVTAQPDKGFDGLAVVNWILLIIIVVAIGAGIVYLVNKFTKKKGTV